MNFQMNETVESPDAELVSRVLETCLRAQWHEVAREGSTIVLLGLGPSHRVNRNDRAVFAVRAVEGGRTAIEANVTYQASALVGASAPQNELVRRKLDGVIELVRMDLDLARRRAAQAGERELKPRIVNRAPVVGLGGPERSGSGIQSAHVAANGTLSGETTGPVAGRGAAQQSAAPVPMSAIAGQATDVAKSAADTLATRNAVAVSESVVAAKPDAAATQEKTDKAVAEPKTQPAATNEFAKVAARLAAAGAAAGTSAGPPRDAAVPVPRGASRVFVAAPPMAEPGLVHRGDDDEYAEERHASAGKIFGILLVVFVLVGAAQVGWEYRAPVKQRVTDMRTNLGAKLTAAEGRSIGRAGAPSASTAPAANTAQAASTAPAASQPDPAELAKAPQAAKLAESDPKAWLANWAGALAGRDAAAQAAYYADPVDKYFLRRSVARADVLADKQASVAKRSGPWALTLDDVVVAQQTDTTARILLVKHIVSANGAGERREERLPTQIRLKKVGGQWRIVSEQTLG